MFFLFLEHWQKRFCSTLSMAGWCVVFVIFSSGCAAPSGNNSSYIDQVLQENLGEQVNELRTANVAPVPLEPSLAETIHQQSIRAKSPPKSKAVEIKAVAPAHTITIADEKKTGEDVIPIERPSPLPTLSWNLLNKPGALKDLPDLPADDVTGQVAQGKPLATDVTIQPDTVLWVSVEEDPSLNGKYIVNEYSAIDFGYVGLVLLNDMTVEIAEGKLKSILESRYLKKATVSVRIAKASYDRIGVSGMVITPGLLKIGPGSTVSLNDALRRAGGLRADTAAARVKIIRGGLLSPFGPVAQGEIYPLISEDGKPTIPPVVLANNDLVFVFSHETAPSSAPSAGAPIGVGDKKIILLGEVPRQGVIQFAANEPCTLMYLLFKIGGLPRFAKADAIRIMRRDKDGREIEIQADAQNLLQSGNPEEDVILQNGDRVIVPARRISFF